MKYQINLNEITIIFKTLCDPNRLRIIRMLASNMVDTLTVSELAKKLSITQPAASQHIKILKNIHLLEPNKQGYRVYYHINLNVLTEIKKSIDAMFELVYEKCSKFETCRGHDDND